MAEKRYQVFVSSTYEDLKEERLEALNALLTAKCFVAGMEYFPAIDKDQFEYIKKIIDDCDLYLLILGGRYGTIPTGEDKSYTEKEFDYAVEKGKKIIALLHKNPGSLAQEKCEETDCGKEKYKQFFEKAKKGRMADFWSDKGDLRAKIIASVYQTKDEFPNLPGWIRGDKVAKEDILEENYKLKKEIDEANSKLKAQYFDASILDKQAEFTVFDRLNKKEYIEKIKYKDVIECMFTYLLTNSRFKNNVDSHMEAYITSYKDRNSEALYAVKEISFNKFIILMQLLELIDIKYGEKTKTYEILPAGRALAKSLLLS